MGSLATGLGKGGRSERCATAVKMACWPTPDDVKSEGLNASKVALPHTISNLQFVALEFYRCGCVRCI